MTLRVISGNLFPLFFARRKYTTIKTTRKTKMFDKSKLRKAYVPVSDVEKEEIKKLHNQGYTIRSIAKAFNRSPSVIRNVTLEK